MLIWQNHYRAAKSPRKDMRSCIYSKQISVRGTAREWLFRMLSTPVTHEKSVWI